MESSVFDDGSSPRMKFLCSFAGTILPRPLDGKLRYVGGETRIVSLPHDISYAELMAKMKELFEGVTLLKYQQPDEDIDALVSVVNDDDVMNMMEEYDKLGSEDSFTRLRIFLFSHPEHDASPFDSDERDGDRRYVDALNNPTDVPEFRRPPDILVVDQSEKLGLSEQQFFNPMMFDRYHKETRVGNESCEVGVHSQRNCEIPMQPHYNLHHLAIPHQPSGHCSPAIAYQEHEMHMQGLAHMTPSPSGGSAGGRESHQQSLTLRYSEMETPWSSGYYSPRLQIHHDPRMPVMEFPNSPGNRYRLPFGDLHDKVDRLHEEYVQQPESATVPVIGHCTAAPIHQATHEHRPPFVGNLMRMQQNSIPVENVGCQAHLNHSQCVYDGNNVCEYCLMAFQRSQSFSETRHPDPRRRQGQPHMERSGSGNEISQLDNACSGFFSGKEAFLFNHDTQLDHALYARDQNGPRAFYNDAHNQERGWVLHQLNHRVEEQQTQLFGTGRANEKYMVDGSINIPFSHSNCCESHSVSSNCINRDEPRYIHPGSELGDGGFHDQNSVVGFHMHRHVLEDPGISYGNFRYAHAADNLYQVSHGSATVHALPRKAQNGMHGGPSYEASGLLMQPNGTASASFLSSTQEGSPPFSYIGVDDQNPWMGQCDAFQKRNAVEFDVSIASEYLPDHAREMNLHKLNFGVGDENRVSSTAGLACGSVDAGLSSPGAKRSGTFANFPRSCSPLAPEPIQFQPDLLGIAVSAESLPPVSSSSSPINDDEVKAALPERNVLVGVSETKCTETLMEDNAKCIPFPDKNHAMEYSPDDLRLTADMEALKLHDVDAGSAFEQSELSVQCLSFIPELMASVKRAALEGAEEVKARAHANDDDPVLGSKECTCDGNLTNPGVGNLSLHELEPANSLMEMEGHSDGDHTNISKIEPTKAEAEALARGLQTIKNDDLEEIRELGSGTYGSVYHGKWKGSDVAIKRIKASCFAGKPSERERLIADFWKEALILSSLHHPNIVSFYGIVRDGPDGSLATVTEFMVNGSLKQFLQKKDRTIDRRKRLIIAMDTSFGMEYLHGKNIVHFDLKCENLLVNMRDPHRPICKIGDLGLSKVKQQTLVSGGVRGTLPWMAPELLSGKSNMVTEKIDVYSYGIVMWELLTGEEPYADLHCASIIGGIVNNSLRPQIPAWCDPEWKSLMESCWSCEPGERPSFSEISQKLRKISAAINLK